MNKLKFDIHYKGKFSVGVLGSTRIEHPYGTWALLSAIWNCPKTEPVKIWRYLHYFWSNTLSKNTNSHWNTLCVWQRESYCWCEQKNLK